MNYFETIKCDDSEIYNIIYHQKRIARTIGKNFNLLEYIYPQNNQLLKCKVTYNDDEIIDITFDLYKKRDVKIFKLVTDNLLDYKFKYEDRDELNFHFSNKKNADDIIIIKDNFITDTSIANIAIFMNDQWYTPKTPLLLGTTRQRYLDKGELKEIDIDVDTFKKAEKIALLNAMIDFDVIEDFKILS